MKPSHTLVLTQFYSRFVEGNFQGALDLCAESMTFQVPGKSPLAGKFTRANFIEGFAQKMKSLSGGSHQFEIHDILASDLHATVLGSHKVTSQGKTTELRTVHVWRFDGEKPLAGYEYPRDLYQYDATWTA